MSVVLSKLSKNKLLLEKLFLVAFFAGHMFVIILLFSDELLHLDSALTWFYDVDAIVDGCQSLLNDISIFTCLFSFHLISMFICLLFIVEHDLDYDKFISFKYVIKFTKDFINLLKTIRNELQLFLIKVKSLINILTTYFLVSTAEISCSYLPFV